MRENRNSLLFGFRCTNDGKPERDIVECDLARWHVTRGRRRCYCLSQPMTERELINS